VLNRLKADGLSPAAHAWVDSGRIERSGAPEKDGLRRGLEAVSHEACFGEDVTLDIAGNLRYVLSIRHPLDIRWGARKVPS
jgi:hypothetical protein